jgi:hypothetical protein
MRAPIRTWFVLAFVAGMLLAASYVSAQVEDQLDNYSATNGEGYMQPLADGIGAGLNGGIWRGAYVPKQGFYIALEFPLVATFFSDDQRTFKYTPTAGDNTPIEDAWVPTVVGDTEGGTIPTTMPPEIVYAPGFDINSFALAVPQIRIGAFRGTEAVIRYISVDVGDTEFGSSSLIGFGARHCVSQWMGEDFPVDISAGFFYQSFKLGDDLIDATALTYGVQVGKRLPQGFAVLEPYATISYDTFEMDVTYDYENDDQEAETIELAMESEAAMKFALGLRAEVGFVNLNGEYSFGEQSGFALGLGIAFGTLQEH